jgi:hypothetical protein
MPIAVIDFETTGSSPGQGARATEIAAVLVEGGRIVGHCQSPMYSGAWVPPFIEQLTGLSDAMLADATTNAQLLLRLQEKLALRLGADARLAVDHGLPCKVQTWPGACVGRELEKHRCGTLSVTA